MGSTISRFRKQPTTIEQLKKIEDGLKKIEDYKKSTEQKQKRIVANVIIYGAALYVLACVIVFVWYLPDSSFVRLGLLIPLILVPVIIYWMKRLISKYFNSKMVRANEEYADLQKKKTDIINTVMETETFNKAKEILSKYAPEKLGKKLQELNASVAAQELNAPVTAVPGKTPVPDLRKRNVAPQNTAPSTRNTVAVMQHRSPLAPIGRVEPNNLMTPRAMNSSMGPRMPLPPPLFPKDRSFSDKLVEYIVGDGPGYRFALICNFCRGHNGMAVKEEFPYMSFTCCYCMAFNPARCQRPSAPRLQEPHKPPALPAPETKPALTAASRAQPKMEKGLPKETLQRKKLQSKTNEPESSENNHKFPTPVPFDEFINKLGESQDDGATSTDEAEEIEKSSDTAAKNVGIVERTESEPEEPEIGELETEEVEPEPEPEELENKESDGGPKCVTDDESAVLGPIENLDKNNDKAIQKPTESQNGVHFSEPAVEGINNTEDEQTISEEEKERLGRLSFNESKLFRPVKKESEKHDAN